MEIEEKATCVEALNVLSKYLILEMDAGKEFEMGSCLERESSWEYYYLNYKLFCNLKL